MANANAKNRMQITKDTKGAAPILMIPDPKVNDGLLMGMLVSVSITDIETTKTDGGWADFVGLKIPRLDFNFVEIPATKGKAAGIYRKSITPVPNEPNSTKYDWWFEQTPQIIVHLIEAYVGDAGFKDEYEALLGLGYEDDAKPEEVLNAFRAFFEGVVTVFNGDGANIPCIYKKDGKALPVWLKLLMSVGNNKVNNGNYGFPGYPGDGVIELFKEGVKPSIRIKAGKGESILDAAPTPNAAIPPTGGGDAGADVPDWMK